MEIQVKLPNIAFAFLTNAYSHMVFKTDTQIIHVLFGKLIGFFSILFFMGLLIPPFNFFYFPFKLYPGIIFYYCGLRRFCNIEQ